VSIHVSQHACLRYQERVESCTIAEARAHILESARAITAAAKFGCQIVRRWKGERLVLKGERVVSVFAAGDRPHQICNPYHQRELLEGAQL
jgi:hypothetical protein